MNWDPEESAVSRAIHSQSQAINERAKQREQPPKQRGDRQMRFTQVKGDDDPDFGSLERSHSAKRADQMGALLSWKQPSGEQPSHRERSRADPAREVAFLREKSNERRRQEGMGMHESLQWKGDDSPFRERGLK